MNRAFTNILAADVGEAARFYERLLGMTRRFDSDWFVMLGDPDREATELGIMDREGEVVPEGVRARPQGVMLTFVVDDVEAVFERARAMDAAVLEPPTDMSYGQRRMLLRDPDGTVVDVSAPTAPRP